MTEEAVDEAMSGMAGGEGLHAVPAAVRLAAAKGAAATPSFAPVELSDPVWAEGQQQQQQQQGGRHAWGVGPPADEPPGTRRFTQGGSSAPPPEWPSATVARAALRLQAFARRAAAKRARWNRYHAIMCVQAAARRWVIRRANRPKSLGPPVAHPMTRTVVQTSRFFAPLPDKLRAGNKAAGIGALPPRRARPQAGSKPMTATGYATYNAKKRHSAAALDVGLQKQLELARQKQMSQILRPA